MHGLGGSIAQFAPLLTTLVNTAPCLAIDLPGCGLSDFKPNHLDAYTTTAFAELLFAAIDRFRDKAVDQKVVLIGHSMGCSISALLASSLSPLAHLCSEQILGMIAICPRSSPLSPHDLSSIRRLNRIPSWLFDMMRMVDRRGGLDSISVARVVGKDADVLTRKLQLQFNLQSKTPVFQKFCLGMHAMETNTAASGQKSLLGERTWSGIKVPLFLIAAESDKLAPPKNAEQIAKWLTEEQKVGDRPASTEVDEEIAPDVQAEETGSLQPLAVAGDVQLAHEQLADFRLDQPSLANSTAIQEENSSTKHSLALKTTVFPAPASHGLLYDAADVRILSGLIENFAAKHIDARLSPGWQLQFLTTSGKWDVKNLAKWQSIIPCSDPIAGVFRAMKTMREVDDEHNPTRFVEKFGASVLPDGVAMVLDISHESPVYDKTGLERAGVEYHKFPTVSKLPPTTAEVEQFLSLVDGLRRAPCMQPSEDGSRRPTIGVHCHYGFNRTGFFIVSYLVERLGYKLDDAVAEFAQKKAPGIKHEYFVNELYVRYAVKMERRGTIIGS
jgi:pimeloyl-ACP methyl ester carboxylesterase/protein-tyrosine phosphatase